MVAPMTPGSRQARTRQIKNVRTDQWDTAVGAGIAVLLGDELGRKFTRSAPQERV